MSDHTLSQLLPEEAEALAELAALVWRTHYPGIISPAQIDYMLAQRYHPPLIRQQLARGDRWDVAREAAGRLIAFAHSYPLEGGAVKLDKLYVHPHWQRQGIGQALLARIEARSRSAGRSHLVLRVNRANHQAIAAYRKWGFFIAREVVEDIGGGFVMDDYVMIKPL
ncbi:MAG: GNAT family N-acetyltransferase [Thiobacillaceae bacterium]|nr:GNAT family N-acetyltransferase [Thiobacillaceae bacterium]